MNTSISFALLLILATISYVAAQLPGTFDMQPYEKPANERGALLQITGDVRNVYAGSVAKGVQTTFYDASRFGAGFGAMSPFPGTELKQFFF